MSTHLPRQWPPEVAATQVPDEIFDRYAHLVRATLGVPVGLVSLVSTDVQVFPGAEGLPAPWQQTRRTDLSHSFCQHVVAHDTPLVIDDARQDPRVADNLAIPDIGVIAYAGFPIHAADGTTVGSLCAIDTAPRQWTQHELDVLANLAATATSELALRAAAQHLQASLANERAAQDAVRAAAAQISGLAEVALALVDLEDVTDLVTVIAERGLAALGADGGAVAVADVDDPHVLLSYVTASYGPGAQADYARLPLDTALPVCEAARTGTRVLVADQQACSAYSPAMAEVVTATGSVAFASLPMRADGRVIGVMTAGWDTPQTFTGPQVALLEAFAAQCAQALQRLQARDAERRAAAAELRAGDLARASTQRQAALVGIARSLADTETESDVLDVVAARGTALLAASVWGLALGAIDGGTVRILGTDDIDPDVRARVQQLPADFALPVVRSATSGTVHYLRDLDETAAAFPAARQLYTAAGLKASASVPLKVRGQLLGSLSVALGQAHTWTAEEQDLLGAFAGLTAQALARISAHEAEQTAMAAASGIAETLQRAMLTAPPAPGHLQIAVRYAATAKTAEVGGDWYDAFVTSTGLTSVVVGDVTGHDMTAAAVMGQLRNLLRGIAFTLGEPPSAVMAAVDRAAAGLGIDTVATAILAQVEQSPEHRAAGTRLLRWSNAGHLPPLLISAEGTARFLEEPPDLVLGWDPAIARHDHEVVLEPGATVLLYTDGLIERRGVHLERGLAWLAEAAAELVGSAGTTLEELCDGLVELVGDHLDDDVALLALRAHPEGEPRPLEAGPAHVPAGLGRALAAAEQAEAF